MCSNFSFLSFIKSTLSVYLFCNTFVADFVLSTHFHYSPIAS